MKKMLPEGPVRQKMISDGLLTDEEIQGFFDGVYVTSAARPAPPIIASAPKLVPPKLPNPVAAEVRPAAPMNGMLAALQQVNLRNTDMQKKTRPPSVAAKNAPGMLSMLATAMNNRRDLIKDASDDEDESDGGFSDDDFDDI